MNCQPSHLMSSCSNKKKKMYNCDYCDLTSAYKQNIIRHMKNKHPNYVCEHCKSIFHDGFGLRLHSLTAHNMCLNCNKHIENKYYKRHIKKCDKQLCRKFMFNDNKNIKRQVLTKLNNSPLPIKWILNRKVNFVKYVVESEGTMQVDKETSAVFRSVTHITFTSDTLIQQIDEAFDKIDTTMLAFQSQGSGWILASTDFWQLYIYKFQPMYAKTYIPTPSAIVLSKAVLNIHNDDNKCFLWSVLAALHKVDSNAWLVSKYVEYEQELNMRGIAYPVKLSSIDRFERQNSISINVFALDSDRQVFPLRLTKVDEFKHVNLLWLKKGRLTHYCLIRNFNRLMAHTTKAHGASFFCYYCLQRFKYQRTLDNHIAYCKEHEFQRVQMPYNKTLKFTNYSYQLKLPYVIYGDFECFVTEHEHVPSGFGLVVVDENQEIVNQHFYSDDNVMDEFFRKLLEIYEWIKSRPKYPISMAADQEHAFQSATRCYLCDKAFDDVKVRDHNHRVQFANYRGAAHQSCNANLKEPRKIPVVFHNLKNYDAHLIMQQLGKYMATRRVNCIAQDTEKYITFSIDDLSFIDSFNFLNRSLGDLASDLDTFRYVHHPLLQCKGLLPYEYLTDRSKFNDTKLPPIEAFFSKLTQEGIKVEEYEHAQRVWQTFDIVTMKQYHDLYLETDVKLLADVFETFRELCMSDYKLEPLHFVSLPGFSWNAALKMTGVELELLQDINKHLFIEAGIRGGISMVSKRYSKANNKYMETYDPDQESKYIMYYDCNSLYATVMFEPLPVGGFKWVTRDEYLANKDDKYGYILEVDLLYGDHLHDAHNDYPLAPERLNGKLVPNLNNKSKYVLHYRALRKYQELGLRVTKYHKILQFEQRAWLKPYIEFNIEKRKHARSEFAQDFYKLLNNSFYGRTLMNKRKHRDVRLVHESQLAKLVAKPRFDYAKEFDNRLYAVQMHKLTVKLDSPIYLGMTILDLSKVVMYDFYYGYLSKFNRTLLVTDTDSFIFEVLTDDFYDDIKHDLHHFDTAKYPRDHPLYSPVNKKVTGKFKDELNGYIMKECVGLRPKLYSYITNKDEVKKAKGVCKATIKHKMKHEDYLQCLKDKGEQTQQVTRIKSTNHHLSTYTSTKTVLSCNDDKRIILQDGVNTLALGHYSLRF